MARKVMMMAWGVMCSVLVMAYTCDLRGSLLKKNFEDPIDDQEAFLASNLSMSIAWPRRNYLSSALSHLFVPLDASGRLVMVDSDNVGTRFLGEKVNTNIAG